MDAELRYHMALVVLPLVSPALLAWPLEGLQRRDRFLASLPLVGMVFGFGAGCFLDASLGGPRQSLAVTGAYLGSIAGYCVLFVGLPISSLIRRWGDRLTIGVVMIGIAWGSVMAALGGWLLR